MPDLNTLVATMVQNGDLSIIALNPLAQFGTPNRRYIGAEILPERLVPENSYHEPMISYRTVIANDGTRYSPVQKKGGDLFGDMLVDLGNSDIGREFDSKEYEALLKLLGNNAEMLAMASLTNWADTALNRALVEHNERQRWMAICNASVVRTGDNGYSETVPYPNPAGHRANAGGTWSNNSYDPFTDIFAMADLLASKGFTVNRIVTSRTVASIMANNSNVKARVGLAVVNASGQIQSVAGRATMDAMNNALVRDGLPPMETYDLQYRTSTGTGFFYPRNGFTLIATTARDATIDVGDQQVNLDNTIGYSAIGKPTGHAAPGRIIRLEPKENKPPRIEGEGWQASLPVILDPEAIAHIGNIS